MPERPKAGAGNDKTKKESQFFCVLIRKKKELFYCVYFAALNGRIEWGGLVKKIETQFLPLDMENTCLNKSKKPFTQILGRTYTENDRSVLRDDRVELCSSETGCML